MIAAILIALLFLGAITVTNSTIPPDCDDEECISDAMERTIRERICQSDTLLAYSLCDYN